MKISITYYFKTLFLILFLGISNLFAQLQITPVNAAQAVQDVLVGNGVTVSNIQFSGASVSLGKFVTGANATNLGFTQGLILSSGKATEAAGGVSFFASTDNSTGSDPQLASLITQTVKDACVLKFNFVPESDTILFQYVFGSEEYPEYANSGYNDVFGFFISGPNPAGGNYTNYNIARLPGSTTPVTINNVNNGTSNNGPCQNCQYYVNNQSPANPYISYDGKTVVLTALARVIPCTEYQIKLAIGDAGDGVYDSGVFLKANSFTSPQIQVQPIYQTSLVQNHMIEGCSDVQVVFKLPFVTNVDRWVEYYFQGTATPDVDYTILPNNYNYAVIPAHQDSVVVSVHALSDGITEGTEIIKLIVQTSVCSANWDTVYIPIYDNIPITLEVANDTLLCDGGQYDLWVNATHGIPPYTYAWNNSVSTPNQTVIPPQSTTYVISVSDGCNNISTDSVTVLNGNVSIVVMSDTTICEGSPVNLRAYGPGTIVWNGLSGTEPTVAPNVSTTYVASITNICGTASDSVTIFTDIIPVFDIGNDTLICSEDWIIIGPLFVNGIALWNTGQTSTQILVNQPSKYTLTVTNGTCKYKDSLALGYTMCNFWIPNSFSPDNDGLNETFRPSGFPPENYEMLIFDRWGKLIYSTEEFEKGWDGKIEGVLAPVGIYVYKIFGNAVSTKAKIVLKQGNLNLIR